MLYFPASTVTVLVVLGVLACVLLLVRLLVLHRNGDRTRIRRIARVAVPAWAIGLMVAVFSASPQPDPSIPGGTFNWVPFLAHGERDLGVELAANLGLFAPLALVLAFCWRSRAVAKTTLLVLGLSACVEVAQLLLDNNRAADITDVITNTAGGLAAASICWALTRIKASSTRDTAELTVFPRPSHH
ncbi:VanZ family protein [Paeniglutamicibacter sp. NPDC091659]|uniref:VanZ family protein n=1 Tax=Paeniglutamicibacter sp. NPDC091659 TaxID=3364389 RepID=UPI003812C0D8